MPYVTFHPIKKVYLTRQEIEGLTKLIEWLDHLPPAKRSVPSLLISPEKLLIDARQLVEEHKDDDQDKAITNQPSLFWLTRQMVKEFRETYRRQRTQLERLKAQAEKQRKAEAKEAARAEKEAFKAGKAAAAAQAQAQREFADPSIYRMQQLNRMQPTNNAKIASGKTLQLPSSLQGLIAQSSVKPLGIDGHGALNGINSQPISVAPILSSVPETDDTDQSAKNKKKPNVEHSYNVPASKYNNPHYPHDYAYNPYRKSVFESTVGGAYYSTDMSSMAYSTAAGAAAAYRAQYSPPFTPHSPRKPPPPLSTSQPQLPTSTSPNGFYWPRGSLQAQMAQPTAPMPLQQHQQQQQRQVLNEQPQAQLEYDKSMTPPSARPVAMQQQHEQHRFIPPYSTTMTGQQQLQSSKYYRTEPPAPQQPSVPAYSPTTAQVGAYNYTSASVGQQPLPLPQQQPAYNQIYGQQTPRPYYPGTGQMSSYHQLYANTSTPYYNASAPTCAPLSYPQTTNTSSPYGPPTSYNSMSPSSTSYNSIPAPSTYPHQPVNFSNVQANLYTQPPSINYQQYSQPPHQQIYNPQQPQQPIQSTPPLPNYSPISQQTPAYTAPHASSSLHYPQHFYPPINPYPVQYGR